MVILVKVNGNKDKYHDCETYVDKSTMTRGIPSIYSPLSHQKTTLSFYFDAISFMQGKLMGMCVSFPYITQVK